MRILPAVLAGGLLMGLTVGVSADTYRYSYSNCNRRFRGHLERQHRELHEEAVERAERAGGGYRRGSRAHASAQGILDRGHAELAERNADIAIRQGVVTPSRRDRYRDDRYVDYDRRERRGVRRRDRD
jgi:hypothetical protein